MFHKYKCNSTMGLVAILSAKIDTHTHTQNKYLNKEFALEVLFVYNNSILAILSAKNCTCIFAILSAKIFQFYTLFDFLNFRELSVGKNNILRAKMHLKMDTPFAMETCQWIDCRSSAKQRL